MRTPLEKAIRKSAQRHIFSRLRFHIRLMAAPVYMLFAICDYVYRPDLVWTWLGLRFFFAFATFAVFYAVVKSSMLRRHIEWPAAALIALSSLLIDIMIYQTGGYQSLYTTGLILCATTGLQVFRLRKLPSLFALTISYIPAAFIILATAPREELHLAVIQASFLIGMTILSTIYGKSEEQVDKFWVRTREIANAEIERHKRTEILKRHFPKIIRDTFEQNPHQVVGKKLFENAVVGFADIVASSKLANTIPLEVDWELKERFLEAATRRAIESEMVVLTHLGDGFLFLANYNDSKQWYYNLISFYENLVRDFNNIMFDLQLESLGIESGVKFGVSSGPAMVGFLGKDQAYFTAIGPDVNLAARLCSEAEPNKIVVSSRVWYNIKSLLVGWDIRSATYSNLKGFDIDIAAVHISPRLSGRNDLVCAECQSTMALIQTEDGFLDYRCINGHNKPSSQAAVPARLKNVA